jgi:hypothetical protein
VESGGLHELKICRRAPGISHLLFADDCLMFFEGTTQQATVVMILRMIVLNLAKTPSIRLTTSRIVFSCCDQGSTANDHTSS